MNSRLSPYRGENMGKDRVTRTSYKAAVERFAPEEGPVTRKAEQQVRETGKLNPLVDPAGYGVTRLSLPRVKKREDGLWELLVGTPMPIVYRADTTSSMGHNVDIVLEKLAETYDNCTTVLPGYDLQISNEIFNDILDRIVMCRSQFEMTAEKIVEQLTLMAPQKAGGDIPEDPHYGLFAAVYLTKRYIDLIGLRGYDFTISDAPGRDELEPLQLKRIFNTKDKDVFEIVAENGYQINPNDLPSTKEIAQELLKSVHAFFLQVGNDLETRRFWARILGEDRVVVLPKMQLLPQVQAAIIGLTEGTIDAQEKRIKEFLIQRQVSEYEAGLIYHSVKNIPIGAQAKLPNFGRQPQQGDLFAGKPDINTRENIWPINSSGEIKPDEGKKKILIKPPKKTVEWL